MSYIASEKNIKNNYFINTIITFDTEGIFKNKKDGKDMTSKEIRETIFPENSKSRQEGYPIESEDGLKAYFKLLKGKYPNTEKKIVVLSIGSEQNGNFFVYSKDGYTFDYALNELTSDDNTHFLIQAQGHYQAVRSDKKPDAVWLFNEFSKYKCYGDDRKNIKAEAIIYTHHSRIKTEDVKNEYKSDIKAIERFEQQQYAAERAVLEANNIISRRNHNITAGVFGSVSGASGVLGGLQHFGILSTPVPKEILFGAAVLAAVVMVIALATRPGKPRTTDKTNDSNLINVNGGEHYKNKNIEAVKV